MLKPTSKKRPQSSATLYLFIVIPCSVRSRSVLTLAGLLLFQQHIGVAAELPVEDAAHLGEEGQHIEGGSWIHMLKQAQRAYRIRANDAIVGVQFHTDGLRVPLVARKVQQGQKVQQILFQRSRLRAIQEVVANILIVDWIIVDIDQGRIRDDAIVEPVLTDHQPVEQVEEDHRAERS